MVAAQEGLTQAYGLHCKSNIHQLLGIHLRNIHQLLVRISRTFIQTNALEHMTYTCLFIIAYLALMFGLKTKFSPLLVWLDACVMSERSAGV